MRVILLMVMLLPGGLALAAPEGKGSALLAALLAWSRNDARATLRALGSAPPGTDREALRARALLALGLPVAALEPLGRVISSGPDAPSLSWALRELTVLLGELEPGEHPVPPALLPVNAADRDDRDRLAYLLGRSYLRQGPAQLAREALSRIHPQGPLGPQAAYLLALLDLRRGDLTRAEARLEEVRVGQLTPGLADLIHLSLARLALHQGEAMGARKLIRHVDPTGRLAPQARVVGGWAHLEASDPEAALATVLPLLDDPQPQSGLVRAEALLVVTSALLSTGRHDEARLLAEGARRTAQGLQRASMALVGAASDKTLTRLLEEVAQSTPLGLALADDGDLAMALITRERAGRERGRLERLGLAAEAQALVTLRERLGRETAERARILANRLSREALDLTRWALELRFDAEGRKGQPLRPVDHGPGVIWPLEKETWKDEAWDSHTPLR